MIKRPRYIEARRLLMEYLVKTLRFTLRQKSLISRSVTDREIIDMHRRTKGI